VGVFMTRS